MQASRQATRLRSLRSARRRTRVVTGRSTGQPPTRSRPAPSPASSHEERDLSFDAYATHPYPTRPNAPPTERVRWPNVTLSQLPDSSASTRPLVQPQEIPVWITEYGYQTKPGDRLGSDRGAAGPLPRAGDESTQGRPPRAALHLVHLPRLRARPLAERSDDRVRAREAVLFNLPVARADRWAGRS